MRLKNEKKTIKDINNILNRFKNIKEFMIAIKDKVNEDG